MTDYFIGKRGSGKTSQCVSKAQNHIDRGILTVNSAMARHIENYKCPCCKKAMNVEAYCVGQDLSNVKTLVIDELPLVLEHMLRRYMNFQGEIVFASMNQDDIGEIVYEGEDGEWVMTKGAGWRR